MPSRFRDYVPARHPALRYGLALNDRGYFWEAQEILEAVWAAAPQGGRERILQCEPNRRLQWRDEALDNRPNLVTADVDGHGQLAGNVVDVGT